MDLPINFEFTERINYNTYICIYTFRYLYMEFKKLELEPESGWIKRTIKSPHTKKTIVYTLIGAAGGFLYFYLTEGKHMDVITTTDVVKSLFIGGFFGFFITNSPCARGRC